MPQNLNRFVLVPYVKIDGEWSISDIIMHKVWTNMVRDKTLRIVFRDGEADTIEGFTRIVQSTDNLVSVIFNRDDATEPPTVDIVAIVWLNRFGPNYALTNHCFFREFWGDTQEAATMALDFWFGMSDGVKPIFDVLLGQTPADNRLGVSFAKRLGFTILGEIPHVGIVSYMTRDSWERNAVGLHMDEAATA